MQIRRKISRSGVLRVIFSTQFAAKRTSINAQNAQGMIGANMKGDIPQAGGKRRRHRKNHKGSSKRGGNFLAIAEQAAAPLALIAMNNSLGKGRRHSRKHRRH